MNRPLSAIVGVGATPYFKRGRSLPQTLDELVCKAILAALVDAGLTVADVDGFAFFSGGFDTPLIMETLGIPEIGFTASLTGAGGGSAGMIGLAEAAIVSGQAKTVVCVGGVQQADTRFGEYAKGYAPSPLTAFYAASGLVGPGQMFALLAQRHMHVFGTTRESFAEVAISNRINAQTHPDALMKKPMAIDDYFAAPMISDPLCLYDFCLESDGAIAVILTSPERARDLRQKPVPVLASVHGGRRDWGRSLYWMNMSDDEFLGSGNSDIARRLYDRAGLGPADIHTAQIYDHFTPMVIAQLEDYGFCPRGEGGPFALSGAIRMTGSLPVNTDGGQLSGAYIWGMSHIREAVEQMRGTAANQVAGAQTVLVTGGPSSLPNSALILGAAA